MFVIYDKGNLEMAGTLPVSSRKYTKMGTGTKLIFCLTNQSLLETQWFSNDVVMIPKDLPIRLVVPSLGLDHTVYESVEY